MADVIMYYFIALFQNKTKKHADKKRALKCSVTSETAFYSKRDNILYVALFQNEEKKYADD